MTRLLFGFWIALSLGLSLPAQADTADAAGAALVLRVGPERSLKTIAQAARLAASGTTVEVDAGPYEGDVAVWTQNQITLRAVGGRVRLVAAGAAAEGKAIWVVRGGRVTIEGFDFVGARVPSRNGAGIRFEQGQLLVRDCTFIDNENGILTGGQPDAELDIENSEFGHNGYGDGQSHNLYVGAIARLSVTGSYFHHARVGHLLKSRAAVNTIAYNRLTDEAGGRASYELEFPNGGVAYVIGNIISQSAQTENPHLISFGAEDYTWPRNALYLAGNTLIDKLPQGGVFLRVKPGNVAVKAVNNLLAGQGKFDSAGPGDYRNNLTVDWGEFVSAADDDYRLKPGSRLVGMVEDPGTANGVNLRLQAEYAHPRGRRALNGKPDNPGAVQSMLPPTQP